MHLELFFLSNLFGGSLTIPLSLSKALIGVGVGQPYYGRRSPWGCLVADEVRELEMFFYPLVAS